MGFPAGVLQVQRCEQDLNAAQFVLLSCSQSRLFALYIEYILLSECCGQKKDITKRKTPFYSALKNLLNKRIFEMTYFSGHII